MQSIQNALNPETVESCISQKQPFCVRVKGGAGSSVEVGVRCAIENLSVAVIKCFSQIEKSS